MTPDPGPGPEFEWGPIDERVLSEIRSRAERSSAQAPPATPPPRRPLLRPAALGVGLAAMLLALAALLIVAPWSADEPEIPPISVLEVAPTADAQRIAELVGTSGNLESRGIRTEALRQMVEGPSGSAFVAPASDDTFCVFYSMGAGIRGTSCGARARLASAPIGVEVLEGGRLIFAGVAPDGYEIARLGGREVPVVANGFILEAPAEPGLVMVTGDGLPDLQLPVGAPRIR